ncbi:hypothetical protein [Vallitalea okinawensis]|uniref:hypothetical protein n=1 Tax=Vallitalea okinawensis TaxID=2078660 RepID=UPI000CFBDF47|nr:hypothetical protein [Vallitalea okinawensis]
MKKSIIAAGIITLGISASVFTSSAYSITTSELANQKQSENYTPRSYGNNFSSRMNNSYYGGYHRGGMMGNTYSSEEFNKYRGNDGNYGSTCHRFSNYAVYEGQEKLSVEEIEAQVLEYIAYYYGEDFSIGDIFEFDTTDYYVSVEETSTGRGAFELLINPYTGDVRHEQGPNMMWNIKYGMMNDINGYTYTPSTTQEIPLEEAVNLANEYLQAYQIDGTVSEEGHHFYGYYTLHIEKDNSVIGMLSVNAYTGDTWIHGWHDNVVNVYSHHEE